MYSVIEKPTYDEMVITCFRQQDKIEQLRGRLAEARTLLLSADVLIPALGDRAFAAESWRKDVKKFLEKKVGRRCASRQDGP